MEKKPKILIAGYEIGGQMQLIAETLRSRGFDAKAAAFNDDARNFTNDIKIRKKKIPIERFLFAQWAIRYFDVFHFFWGVSLFDFWRFCGLDLPVLRQLGKKIIVHFRGTDLVDVNYYKYLAQAGKDNAVFVAPPVSRVDQQKKLKYWKKYASEILVSTPDLIDITGGNAQLVPQVVRLSDWNVEERGRNPDRVIRIAHAPTRRLAKGTDKIIAAIDNLKAKGYKVELVIIENVDYHKIKEAYASCDLGIDQLLIGWYGKVSVEWMAMGMPVICYINEKYSKTIYDLPIINATSETLEGVLETVLKNPSILETTGRQSKKYVQLHHDVEKIADDLIILYSKQNQ